MGDESALPTQAGVAKPAIDPPDCLEAGFFAAVFREADFFGVDFRAEVFRAPLFLAPDFADVDFLAMVVIPGSA
jgi:hypothetical protein